MENLYRRTEKNVERLLFQTCGVISSNCQSFGTKQITRDGTRETLYFFLLPSPFRSFVWGILSWRFSRRDQRKSPVIARWWSWLRHVAPRRAEYGARTPRVLRAWSPYMWAHLSFHSTTTIKAFLPCVSCLTSVSRMRHTRYTAAVVADRGRTMARRLKSFFHGTAFREAHSTCGMRRRHEILDSKKIFIAV